MKTVQREHQKNWFKKIVSPLSWSIEHPWTFFPPILGREKLPYKKGPESHLFRAVQLKVTQINPTLRLKHHEQGPTSKQHKRPPHHSWPVTKISSPVYLWPKELCAALHWRPSVLRGSPTACLSSSQGSTHHPPHLCRAVGWCPCPKRTQILG